MHIHIPFIIYTHLASFMKQEENSKNDFYVNHNNGFMNNLHKN